MTDARPCVSLRDRQVCHATSALALRPTPDAFAAERERIRIASAVRVGLVGVLTMGHTTCAARFDDGDVWWFDFSHTVDFASHGMSRGHPPRSRRDVAEGVQIEEPTDWERLAACRSQKHELESVLCVLDPQRRVWRGKACRKCGVYHGPSALFPYDVELGEDGEPREASILESLITGADLSWYEPACEALYAKSRTPE